MQRDQWQFEFGGQEYRYLGYLGAADALLIKRHAGLSITTFFNGILVGDPAALVAVVFLAKRQAGESVTWDELIEQMDGENDLLALVDTIKPIRTEATEPAQKTERKSRAKQQEPEPAVA